MAKLEELHAIFRWERHRWDSTVIAECQSLGNVVSHEPLLIKATADEGELQPQLTYRFYGRWIDHPRHGRQFHAKTFVRSAPHGETGTVNYLMRAPHVGPVAAKVLWSKFQGDAVRILREDPEVAAAAVDGQFNEEKARAAAEFLEREKGLESCSIDLIELLGGRGFPRDLQKRLVADLGNKAAELIRRNPYLLMRYRGCGFLRTDRMYLDMGGQPDRLKRQAYCAWHAIASNTEGHTWHPTDTVMDGLRERIGGAKVRGPEAVKLAYRGNLLAIHRTNGKLYLAETKKASNETDVARRVREMMNEPAHWPAIASLDVSPHQKEELFNSLQSPLACFGGSPGTGKTFTAARLIEKICHRHGRGDVAVAAPTGKAAVRITEAMQGYGLDLRARTIHSLLGVESRSEADGWGFQHNEDHPLPYHWIVVDESSMIDTDLMANLLRACGQGTHVLFVGDTCQLPPVGHGAPLRDMIAAGVPYGELSEIRRNAGTIVRACAAIRAGQPFPYAERTDIAGGHNLVQKAGDAEAIMRLFGRLRGGGKLDPIWDCQLVVAVNRKSPLSRQEMNERLQLALNPIGRPAKGSPFRVGDKVVNTKNGLFPIDEQYAHRSLDNQEAIDGKVFVANGELGRVVGIQERLTTVRLTVPDRLIKIPRGNGDADDGDDSLGTGCTWDLGYALSVHKSQGSEWPVVIVALDEYPGAHMVCSREWLYTAISRGKQACFLVGKQATAMAMVKRPVLYKRKTFLREQIECR
jgi:exodeoxyribonuclease V alpha subunit